MEFLNNDMPTVCATTAKAGAAASSLLTSLVSFYSLASVADAHSTNTLTNTNAVTFGTGGATGNCATFAAASSQKLVKTTVSGLAASSTGSISAWIKRNGNQAAYAGVVELGSGGLNSMVLPVNVNGVYILQYVAGGAAAFFGESGTLADATWAHYVLTWASGTGNFKLYKNGTLNASDTMAAVTLGGDLAIGYTASTGTYFNGSLDEIGIWNRVLTTAEITTLYGGGTPPAYPF